MRARQFIIGNIQVSGCVMFSDPEALRGKAREFALKAQRAKDHQEWYSMTTLARSHVLLEVNARWLESTGRFLQAIKNNQPWPGPECRPRWRRGRSNRLLAETLASGIPTGWRINFNLLLTNAGAGFRELDQPWTSTP